MGAHPLKWISETILTGLNSPHAHPPPHPVKKQQIILFTDKIPGSTMTQSPRVVAQTSPTPPHKKEGKFGV